MKIIKEAATAKEKYKAIPSREVIVTKTGKITQILTSTNHAGAGIVKVDKNHYYRPSDETGELYEFKHSTSRFDDYNSVRRSLAKLRNYINANVEDPRCCKWVTLTYAENMTNPVRLYEDFRRFNAKLKRWEERHLGYTHEYIIACEPQGRGAWHIHALFIFPQQVPFIPNEIIAEKWGHGFTKTKRLDSVDNVGAYLSAYMGDMFLDDVKSTEAFPKELEIKNVEVSENGRRISKQVIKGARLRLYPPGFNIFRCSRGIKKPEITKTTYAEALKLVEGHTKTFESTYFLVDEAETDADGVNSHRIAIHKECYNSNRAEIKVASGELNAVKRRSPSPDR